MRRNSFAFFPLLVMLLLVLVGSPAHTATLCAAGNPNTTSVLESTPTTDFTGGGIGVTVTHTKTGLMWKQCAEGLSGAGCATGTATTMNWANALKAANTANSAAFDGHTDWRLPNKKELESIIESCGYDPAINQTVFPAMPAGFSYFWSSSSSVANQTYGWYVDFSKGGSYSNSKTAGYYVRLVRSGQSPDSLDSFDLLTPNLTINDVSQNEGNSGTSIFTFTVGLSAPAGAGGVTFDIATADGTATAPGDYTAQSLTNQTISAGNSTFNFSVVVNGDIAVEPDETFFVNITNITNAAGVDTQGQGTIVNDEYNLTYNGNTNTSGTAPSDGSSPYATGATVTVLGAGTLAKTGNTFAGWNTAANGSGTPYAAAATFAIAANITLYAQWTAVSPPSLSVSKVGSGAVTATGISCGTDCSEIYASGTVVTLTATANPAWIFSGWSGDCSGTASTCNLTMDAAKSVVATFTANYTGTLITRYRLYSDGTKEHLYTTDFNEYSVLPVCCGWLAEGAIYKLFQGAGSLSGVAAVPYYRLYNSASFQHHWTTDFNEYTVLATMGWTQEGIDGYILPSAVSGTLPLYRLYLNAFGGLHLWTTDANERNVLTTTAGWVDEGVAGYVIPL